MLAVIMAGGKGTRVASVNDAIPKPMFSICGKPVLLHQIECLRRQGVTRIILITGHLGEQISSYFGDGSKLGVRIDYIWEREPLGQPGGYSISKAQLLMISFSSTVILFSMWIFTV